ncbi:deoxyhypusine synthase [Archaeoglobales archaeon]|nr:MAG: deoxyhypusine synthase [Archaeoglobales archaeon]
MKIESPRIHKKMPISELVEMYSKTAFNARRLGEAAKIFKEMIEGDAFIFLTLAGAMIPSGMRNIINEFLKRDLINAIVSTGANVVHEVIEALGFNHEIGSTSVDDVELAKTKLNRIFDVFIHQKAFEELEFFVSKIVTNLSGSYASYEFVWKLGEVLDKSFLRTAYEKSIPIFCPTLHDSILGLHIFVYRSKDFNIDYFKDIQKILELCCNDKVGVIIIGGGVPKNFALQAMLLSDGFDYAIQITTDSPQWGGLSGASLEEAKSWCKLKPNAKAVTVYCDATIALPMLYSYVLDNIDK